MKDLRKGDARQLVRTIADNHVDSLVMDPPYEIGFMGKEWDRSGIAFDVSFWAQCLRVLKPGGYLLAFGGARTYHRLACAIEDAGFEIKDQIMWVFGSGFPKSLNLRGEHEGKGTGLKPAHEPIVVARKPFKGTVLQNVERHGTGAFNINACRVGFESDADIKSATWGRGTNIIGGNYVGATHPDGREDIEANPLGRWPANLIHDGSDEVLAVFPTAPGQQRELSTDSSKPKFEGSIYGKMNHRSGEASAERVYQQTGSTNFAANPGARRLDSGSAARFFYCAKATRQDRNEGCKHLPDARGGMVSNTSGQHITRRDEAYQPKAVKNDHPTVKPTELMQYLCRLVTPEGGIVGDFLMGSGTTGKAAAKEGYSFIGFEKGDRNFDIATARINHAYAKYAKQQSLFHP